jgi:hypothetical protein
MRYGTGSGNKIKNEWYGIRIAKDSLYSIHVCTVHTSVICIANCFTELSNRLNLTTRRRYLLTDKMIHIKRRYSLARKLGVFQRNCGI